MPIYEYQCRKCRRVTETLQGMSDPPPSRCPACGGKMTRLMSPGAFILKGSGWYATDYARKGNGKDREAGRGKAAKDAPAGDACPASSGAPGACAGCPKSTTSAK